MNLKIHSSRKIISIPFLNIPLRNMIHLVMKKKQEKIQIISQFLALKSELN